MSEPPPVVHSAGVFLSHSSVDKPFVRTLVTLLKAMGVDAWIDELELDFGDGLLERISGQIARSTAVVAVLSENSVRSRWVKYELLQALSLELEGRGPRVIPIRIDDCQVPPFLADRVHGDFSRVNNWDQAMRSLVRAMTSTRTPPAVTMKDELEHELFLTTLRDTDLRLVAQLVADIHSAARTVLLTSDRLVDGAAYRHVPLIRVLLFTVHERFKCLRLQLYVTDTGVVVHAGHRFTLDPARQPHLNPAARAWHDQRVHHVDYDVEYAQDPDAYIEEAVQHGFDRAKVANILVHVASSVSIPVAKLRFHSLGTDYPAVICIDSERRAVFPEASHAVLAEVAQSLVDEYNTGRRSPWQYEDRDFQTDNRGVIDEVTGP